MTTVVHCKREKYTKYIGRPSKWGNPFIIGPHGNRSVVIEKYRQYVTSRPEMMADIRRELKDEVLGCWCHPLPCHGDVLAEIANAE